MTGKIEETLGRTAHAIIAIDTEGRVTFWNRAAEEIYGTSTLEALGKPLTDIYRYEWLSSEDEASSQRSLNQLGFWSGRNRHVINQTGRVIIVDSSVIQLTDHQTNHLTGLMAVIRPLQGDESELFSL